MPRKKKSKTGAADPQREVLKEIYAVVKTPPNVTKARELLGELLSRENASLNQISQLSGIGYVTLINLKNKKSAGVSDKVFLQISELSRKVESGEVSFSVTRKGRQPRRPAKETAGVVKPAVESLSMPSIVPVSGLSVPDPSSQLFFTDPTVLVSPDEIKRKEEEIRRLNAELEYLKEVRAIQERYKGILF